MNDAKRLARLDEEQFVRLRIGDDVSDWRLNDKSLMGQGKPGLLGMASELLDKEPPVDSESGVGLIFQRADASPEWLVLIVQQTGENYDIEEQLLADITAQTEELDGDVELVATAASKEEL